MLVIYTAWMLGVTIGEIYEIAIDALEIYLWFLAAFCLPFRLRPRGNTETAVEFVVEEISSPSCHYVLVARQPWTRAVNGGD